MQYNLNKIFYFQREIEKLKEYIEIQRETINTKHAPFGIGEVVPVGSAGALDGEEGVDTGHAPYEGKMCKITKCEFSTKFWHGPRRIEAKWIVKGKVIKKDGTPGEQDTDWYIRIPVQERPLTPLENEALMRDLLVTEAYVSAATVEE